MTPKATQSRPTTKSFKKPRQASYRLNPLEQQFSDDVDWAQTAEEVQRHQGEFVVVHRKRFVAAGRDRKALLAEAAALENCPGDELAVVVVPAEGFWEIPH
jgi:hypothetical protein